MKWDVYRKGQVIGQVEATSVEDARRMASNELKYSPNQGEVAVVDPGPGTYRIHCTARPVGAIGRYYLNVFETVEAAGVHEALGAARSRHPELEFGMPESIEFLGPPDGERSES